MPPVLIVIPVHDEAATVAGLVARARRFGPVLVVDDGSRDGSAEAAARAGAEVLRLPGWRGKGEALRQGFREALARGVERVLTMDGDGQHDPDDIPRLLRAARAAPEALVVGGRLGSDPQAPAPAPGSVIPAGRLHAIQVAGFFINWLTGVPLLDTQSGLRVYPARLLAAAHPRHGGFVLETEMLFQAAALGVPVNEVPVRARPAPARRSRFRPWRDGGAVGAYLVRRGLARWAREVAAAAAALERPFRPAVMRARHRDLARAAAPWHGQPAAWAAAVGLLTLQRIALTWRGWWGHCRGHGLSVVAAATLALPLLGALALLQPLLGRAGLDPLSPLVARLYSQSRLARVLRGTAGTGGFNGWGRRAPSPRGN
jgi:hypothetical protein